MKKQTIFARSIETLEGMQAPETIISRHLVEVSRSVQGMHKYVGALYEIKRPASVDTAHYYKTGYTEALKDLGTSAVQPVARPMLRLVEDAPRPQNLLKEDIVIDHVLLEQLASKEEVAPFIAPVVQNVPVEPTVAVEAAPLDENQVRINALRSEIHSVSVPIKEAYADLTKAA